LEAGAGVAPEMASAPNSLKKLTAHGSLWTIGGYGLGQALRLGSNLVLTRMLFPEAFGLMALANVFLQGLMMFSDIGLGPAIIRHHPRDDQKFLNTAWTIQIIRGLVLWLLACALAVPIARFYGEPQLAMYVPVAALTVVISGFNSTKFFTAYRDMQYATLCWIDLASQSVAIAVMVAFVFVWPSVWGLVVGGLTIAAMKFILGQIFLVGPTNKLGWDRSAAIEVFHFGRWIFLSTLLTFLALQSDRLMLGRLVSMEMLGVYSIAVTIMTVIFGLFDQLATKVLMPAMVHVSRTGIERFANVALRSRRLVLGAAALAVAEMMLVAPLFVRLAYDPRYREAGWIAQLLGVGLWFMLVQSTSQASLLATDRSRALALSNAANFIVTIIAAPGGFWLWGIAGFIGGWTLGNFAAALILDAELERHGVNVWPEDLKLSFYFVALCGIGFGLQLLLRRHLNLSTTSWLIELIPAVVVAVLGGAVLLRSAWASVLGGGLPAVETPST
jgi:O-antigen/teichoic acid export membrane protein